MRCCDMSKPRRNKGKGKGSWHEAKEIVYERQGGRCAVCGKVLIPCEAVGHHLINKCRGGKNTADNCEVRCVICERYMHELYRYGNLPDKEEIISFYFRRRK